MNPTFPQQIQNNTNINPSNINQISLNQNTKEINIIKIEEQNKTFPTNIINHHISNSSNEQKNVQENKIITQSIIEPQRFTFSGNNDLNLNEVILDTNKRNESTYKQLIKKIASQLKIPVRPQTQGYFYFALQKGEYSLIIIRKISSQMKNHQIEFNNDIFRIYTQKYKRYKELIKRIAHLLKMSMKNRKYFENIVSKKDSNQLIQNNTTELKINASDNIVNSSKDVNIKINNTMEEPAVINKEIKINSKVDNESDLINKRKNQTQTQSQSLFQTNINKASFNYNNKNRYNSNISDKRINPPNPFLASKDKLSFADFGPNFMNTNLQNQNQYFLHKEEKTNTTTSNIESKPIIPQNIILNKNIKKIDVNINKQLKQPNNINQINQNQMNIKVNNNEINNDNKMDIIQEESKTTTNVKTTFINKEKEKTDKPNANMIENNMNENQNIINTISNTNTDVNSLNNINNVKYSIFSTTPINSRFANIKDVEMKNDTLDMNILSEQSEDIKTSKINSSILNSNSNNNNINNKTNSNANIELNKNTVSISNKENQNLIMNKNNENNLSLVNNFDSESKNNLSISSIKKEEDKSNTISIESKRSKRSIQIRLSPFKKNNDRIIEEERSIHSNRQSQNININNIQKLNCNTFTENVFENANDTDSFIQKDISTEADGSSFLKNFDSFLSKNNITIQSYIPMADNNKGQSYLKQNIFWEKYINYIYLNYSLNNVKLSLFSFIQIIEQYYLWCENINNGNLEEIKKLMIETISKIYNDYEIKQFCSMNRISDIAELFEKYKIFMKNNKSFKSDKEIEVKIDNKSPEECNCDLCKSEFACMKKITELNKTKIIGVNTESIFYNANEDKDKDKIEEEQIGHVRTNRKKKYPPENTSGRKRRTKFSESKIKESSGENHEYIAKGKEKSNNKSKSNSKSKRNSSNKKEKKYEKDVKIDTIFKKEEITKVKKEDSEKMKKEERIKVKREDSEDDDSERDKKITKSKKKEKNRRSSSSKKKETKYEIKKERKDSSSESEEKEAKNKKNKNKKKSKSKNKKEKKNKESDDDEEEMIQVKNNKKKRKYPKD